MGGPPSEPGGAEIFGLLMAQWRGKIDHHRSADDARTATHQGRAFIGEYDVWQEQVKAKRLIGVVPQRPNHFAHGARS